MISAAPLEAKEVQNLRDGSTVTAQLLEGDFCHPFSRSGFNFFEEHNVLKNRARQRLKALHYAVGLRWVHELRFTPFAPGCNTIGDNPQNFGDEEASRWDGMIVPNWAGSEALHHPQ